MLHTRAIVLAIRPYREHDELISFFTEHSGKWIVLAKGSRKPTSKLAPMIHGLGIARCSVVEGKRYPILTSLDPLVGGTSEDSWQRTRKLPYGFAKDFYAYYFLYALLALCDDILYEGDRNPKLWDVLSGVLDGVYLAGHNGRDEWIRMYDQWLEAVLESLGHGVVAGKGAAEPMMAQRIFASAYYRSPYPLEPFTSTRFLG